MTHSLEELYMGLLNLIKNHFGLLFVIEVRCFISIFQHINPTITILNDFSAISLFNHRAWRGSIYTFLDQHRLHQLRGKLKGKFKPLNGAIKHDRALGQVFAKRFFKSRKLFLKSSLNSSILSRFINDFTILDDVPLQFVFRHQIKIK
jgi:hypothetical protein